MRSVAMKSDDAKLEEQIHRLAQEVLSEISELEPSHSKELLGTFVSELFLSVAEQERRQMRREKQAEGIAAAKARGVRFGARRKSLPDNFEECRRAWRGGQMSLRQAAGACGMPHASFRAAVMREESMEQPNQKRGVSRDAKKIQEAG